jgi:hypothetical protein
VLNTLKGAALSQSNTLPNKYLVSTALSYVTGSHNFKTGMQWQFGSIGYQYDANADLLQIYRSGVPNSVNVYNTPTEAFTFLNADRGFFVQDTWTRSRHGLNGGVRFEHFDSELENQPAAQTLPPGAASGRSRTIPCGTTWRRGSAPCSICSAMPGRRSVPRTSMASWAGGWAARYSPFVCQRHAQLERSQPGRHRAGQRDRAEQQLKFGVAQNHFTTESAPRITSSMAPACSISCCRASRCCSAITAATSETSRSRSTRCRRWTTTFRPGDQLDRRATITIFNLNPAKRGRVISSTATPTSTSASTAATTANAAAERREPVRRLVERSDRNITDTNDPAGCATAIKRSSHPIAAGLQGGRPLSLPWGFAASATLMSFAGNANQTEVWPFILQTQSLTVNGRAATVPGGQTVAGLTIPVIPPGTKFSAAGNGSTWTERTFRVGQYQ